MRNLRTTALLLALSFPLASCGLMKGLVGSSGGGGGEPTGDPAEAPAQLVGEVASVHGGDGEGFVLIRRYGGGGLPTGFVFHTSGSSGQTSSLRPTGERLGRFYAADITGGTPEVGNVVLARRLPEAAEAPSTPTTVAPEPGFQVP